MKFTQPVSMQCSQEQFESNLKEPLEKLGYKQKSPLILDGEDYLTTNYADNNDYFTFLKHDFIKDKGRYFIDHYNPQLFIALASMTDEHNGIVGEWYRCKDRSYPITYQPKHTNMCAYSWIKATKEELINHFTKAKVHSSPIIHKILNRDKNYAEISLRIDGVLTRFVAEKEHQKMISTYESRIKELEERTNANAEKIVKIKKLLRELNVIE